MSQSIKKQMFLVAAMAALAGGLRAEDGMVLIDQRSAMRGNVTPGDSPGFPVTISQPGSYRLASNLVVPDTLTTAVQITADDVTLDLNGFSIIGPAECNATTCNTSGGGVGVHSGDFQIGTVHARRVRVFNGHVRGMGFHGIRLMGPGSSAERITAHGNGGPGFVVTGTVTNCVSTQNATGMIVSSVRDSVVSENRQVGIFTFSGENGVVTGNMVHANRQTGILANSNTVVSGNVANNNGEYGISAACPSAVIGNTTAGNAFGGIRTIGVCTVVNNAP